MAHLIRPWQVRYLDKDGKRCPRDAPGARTVRERARKWYGQGIPGYPPQKRFPLASDKQVARQMLAKLVHRAERGEAGLEDEATFAQTRPLTEHLQDFAAGLRAKASAPSEKQIKQVLQRIGDTFDACCFVYPRDVNADAIETYLASRRQLLREQGGLSMQTSNFYLAAIKQFCHWMVKKGRLAKTPLRDVEPGNVRLDRRHDRRDLKPEELALLLDVTRASSWIFRGLSGIDRHALYLTSCGTGFRKSELASLTPERFDLDSDPPTVVISAANDTGPFAVSHWARRFAVSPRMTANRPAPNLPSLKQQTALANDKAKKPVTQPLPVGLASHLKGYLQGKVAGQPVWPGTWSEKAAKMLRHDLAEAGIPYKVQGPDGPLFADFHAMRHTYVSMLEEAGAGPKAAQELARHSDPKLTLNRYTHASLKAKASVVNRLALPGVEQSPEWSPEQLATALVLQQTVLASLLGLPLVARRVALNSATNGDASGRVDTNSSGKEQRPPRRKVLTHKENGNA